LEYGSEEEEEEEELKGWLARANLCMLVISV
jgi:hypothetical protein